MHCDRYPFVLKQQVHRLCLIGVSFLHNNNINNNSNNNNNNKNNIVKNKNMKMISSFALLFQINCFVQDAHDFHLISKNRKMFDYAVRLVSDVTSNFISFSLEIKSIVKIKLIFE